MAKSCIICPTVLNQDGKHVDSILWKDLYKLTGRNREKTKQLYKIAQSPTFLNEVQDIAEFDENGQITAHSFLSLSGKESELDDVVKVLNEDFEGDFSINQSVDNVERFNKESSYSKEYVPQIVPNDNGSYHLSITSRNDESTLNLQQVLYKNRLSRKLQQTLNSLGVGYEFVGSNTFNGRFSTENVERSYDSLTTLIQLSTEATDVNSAFVEESAHLAVAAMKDKQLIQRLLSMLTDNVVEQLFTEQEIQDAKLANDNYKYELAGKLVAKALRRQNISGYTSFMNKIRQGIFNIFSKLSLNDIQRDKYLAQMYAEKVANGFLFNEEQFDLDAALSKPMTLYSLNITNDGLLYTVKQIHKYATKLNNQNAILFKDKMRNAYIEGQHILSDILNNRGVGNKVLAAYIREATSVMMSRLEDIMSPENGLLTPDNYNNFAHGSVSSDFYMQTLSQLEEAGLIIDTLKGLQQIITKDSDSDNTDRIFNDEEYGEFKEELASLLSEDSGVVANINIFTNLFAETIAQEVIGTTMLHQTSRIIWGKYQSQKDWTLTEVLGTIDDDDFTARLFGRDNRLMHKIANFFRTLGNRKDKGTQIFYLAQAKALQKNNQGYDNFVGLLHQLKDTLKEYNEKLKPYKQEIKERDLYDYYIDDDGIRQPSQYFAGPILKGQWEYDRQKALQRASEQFYQYLQKSGKFDSYKQKESSEKDEDWKAFLRDEYVPNYTISPSDHYLILNYVYENGNTSDAKESRQWIIEHYVNTRFYRLSDEDDLLKAPTNMPFQDTGDRRVVPLDDERSQLFHQFLVSARRLKSQLDRECLLGRPESSDAVPRISRKMMRRAGKGILDKIRDVSDPGNNIFTDDPLNAKFGTEENPADVKRGSKVYVNLNTIPIWGIRKLSDGRYLSTDFFAAMQRYAAMAYNFKRIQDLEPILTVLDRKLSSRDGDPKYVQEANEYREDIWNTLVYQNKGSNASPLQRAARQIIGILDTISTVTVLATGGFIAGKKNTMVAASSMLAGALSGRYEYDLKSFKRGYIKNSIFNPKHRFGRIASLYLNRPIEFDKYNKKIQRWNNIKNAQTTLDFEHSGIYNYIISLLLSQYNLSDQRIIGMAYESFMSKHKLYKYVNGETVESNASDCIEYNEQGAAVIGDGYSETRFGAELLPLIEGAIKELNDLSTVGKEELPFIDTPRWNKMQQFIDDNSKRYKLDDEVNWLAEARAKNAPLIEKQRFLEDLKNKIAYNEDKEQLILQKVNDYFVSNQGAYGMINQISLQADDTMKLFTRLRGWLWGFMQNQFFEQYNVLTQEIKASTLRAAGNLALSLLTGIDYSEKSDVDPTKHEGYNGLKYRAAVLAYVLPIVGQRSNSPIGKYLRSAGWNPDDLGAVGLLLGLIEVLLAFWAVVRGLRPNNEKKKSILWKQTEEQNNKSTKQLERITHDKGWLAQAIDNIGESYVSRVSFDESTGTIYNIENSNISDSYKKVYENLNNNLNNYVAVPTKAGVPQYDKVVKGKLYNSMNDLLQEVNSNIDPIDFVMDKGKYKTFRVLINGKEEVLIFNKDSYVKGDVKADHFKNKNYYYARTRQEKLRAIKGIALSGTKVDQSDIKYRISGQLYNLGIRTMTELIPAISPVVLYNELSNTAPISATFFIQRTKKFLDNVLKGDVTKAFDDPWNLVLNPFFLTREDGEINFTDGYKKALRFTQYQEQNGYPDFYYTGLD